MLAFIWPMALVIVSNVAYQICARSVSQGMNAFASLTITYLVGAAASLILYFALEKDANLFQEYRKMNWAPAVLGLVIVGLEAGFMYAYKAGWQVSTAALVQSCFLAVLLIIVGRLFFKEALTWKKLAGAAICLIGIAVINS